MIPCSRRGKRPSIRITGKRGLWSMHWQFWVSVIAQNRSQAAVFPQNFRSPRALKRHNFSVINPLNGFCVFAFVPKVMRLAGRGRFCSSGYRQDRFCLPCASDRVQGGLRFRRCHVLSLCTRGRCRIRKKHTCMDSCRTISNNSDPTSWRDNRTFPFEAVTARNAAASRIGIDRFLCQAGAAVFHAGRNALARRWHGHDRQWAARYHS